MTSIQPYATSAALQPVAYAAAPQPQVASAPAVAYATAPNAVSTLVSGGGQVEAGIANLVAADTGVNVNAWVGEMDASIGATSVGVTGGGGGMTTVPSTTGAVDASGTQWMISDLNTMAQPEVGSTDFTGGMTADLYGMAEPGVAVPTDAGAAATTYAPAGTVTGGGGVAIDPYTVGTTYAQAQLAAMAQNE